MARYEDLTGRVFGRLRVLGEDGWKIQRNGKRHRLWKCQCSCDDKNTISVRSATLKNGNTKSCGCYQRERASQAKRIHNHFIGVDYKTKLGQAYMDMHRRCFDPRKRDYDNYGGRGITVCERWNGNEGFRNFISDMGDPPTPQHQLDRIDVNGNYEPSNCRWVTRKENCRNKRTTIMVEYKGEVRPLADVCEEVGLRRQNVYDRIRRGKTFEKALEATMESITTDRTPIEATSEPGILGTD